MESLSAVAAAGSILHAVLVVSKVLHSCITKESDQVFKDLHAEVEGLARILKSVEVGLESPTIKAAEKLADKAGDEGERVELWNAVNDTLKGCNETVERLHKGIRGLTTKDPNQVTQQVLAKIKLSFKESEIATLRSQIQSHIAALTLGLQMVHVRALFQVPGQVMQIGDEIDKLRSSMKTFQESTRTADLKDTDDRTEEASNGLAPPKYPHSLNRTAEKFISSASTAYGKSEAAQSLAGNEDPLTRQRTGEWVKNPGFPGSSEQAAPERSDETPHTRTDQEYTDSTHDRLDKDLTFSPSSPTSQCAKSHKADVSKDNDDVDSSTRQVGSESSHEWRSSSSKNEDTGLTPSSESAKRNENAMSQDDISEGSDSEHHFELEEVPTLLNDGAECYRKGDYKGARDLLEKGVKQAGRLSVKRQMQFDLGEKKLTLAKCLYLAGELDETERLLHALTQDPLSKVEDITNEEAIRQCEACQLLAQIYLRKQKYKAAETSCLQAIKGRGRMLGDTDTLCYESKYLLSIIDEAAGKPEVAKSHLKLIPEDMQESVSQSVRQALEIKVPEQISADYDINKPKEHKSENEDERGPLNERSTHGEVNREDVQDEKTVARQEPKGSIGSAKQPSFIRGKGQSFSNSIRKPPSVSGRSSISNQIQQQGPNFAILADIIAYLPAKVRENTKELVPLEQLDPGMTELLLPWLRKFSADISPYASPLHVAAAIGHLGATESLKDEVDVNAKTLENQFYLRDYMHYVDATPLHMAATYGRTEIGKLLIDCGAILNASDSQGYTPLHYAARTGMTPFLDLLLEHNVDTGARTSKGTTALHIAAMEGRTSFCRTLLSNGVDIDLVNASQNSTAAHFAAADGHVGVLQLLIELSANFERKDLREQTPLHRAIAKGHLEAVQTLLAHGVDIHAKDHHGHTPLHTAAAEGRMEIAKLLLESGASIVARDAKLKIPYSLARERQHGETADFLKKWKKSHAPALQKDMSSWSWFKRKSSNRTMTATASTASTGGASSVVESAE